MRWGRLLTTGRLLRRGVQALETIAGQLQAQNALLTRLADHWAPVPPAEPVDRAERTSPASVSFLDAEEQAQVLAYVARTIQDTGREPTDDEIVTFLADDKTQDLAIRLAARQAEILQRERR